MLRAVVLSCKWKHIQLCVLILSLVMPCSACFPEKSKAIAAQEKEDGAMGPLEVELRMKEDEWHKGLKEFKDDHTDLNNEGVDLNTITITELKTLFEEKYKPYFETLKKVAEYNIAQNKNPGSNSTYKDHIRVSNALLNAIPTWLEKEEKAEMLKRIKTDIKGQGIK